MSEIDLEAVKADIRQRAKAIEDTGVLVPHLGLRAADHYRSIVERHRPADGEHPDPIIDARLARMERQSQLIGELIHKIAFLEHSVAYIAGEYGIEVSFNQALPTEKRVRRRWIFFRSFRRVKRAIEARNDKKK